MTEDFKRQLVSKHSSCVTCPSNESIKIFFDDIMALLFPNFSDHRLSSLELIEARVNSIYERLVDMMAHHPALCGTTPQKIADGFVAALQDIEGQLQLDVEAIYQGDPAAKSKEEIVRSYPGFYAIAAYRVAHLLSNLEVQIMPRVITELAQHRTGIDIHPGALIDHSFCIDHGTGVVIGETTIIGHNVKLYQGVTLGGLSIAKKDADKKRHPTIEPHTVVYANATILGGDTIIGHHSIIGGNSWITKSIAPHSTVYYISGDNQVQKTKN